MKGINGELKLLLNLKEGRATLEECWMEGFHQANIEIAEEFNPYATGSEEAEFWSQGWWAGFYSEEALFPQYAVGLAVEKEAHVMERLMEECEIEEPSRISVRHFLMAMGATVGVCLVATTLLV